MQYIKRLTEAVGIIRLVREPTSGSDPLPARYVCFRFALCYICLVPDFISDIVLVIYSSKSVVAEVCKLCITLCFGKFVLCIFGVIE
jgi:hypothetical protein